MTDDDRRELALALYLWRALRGRFPLPNECIAWLAAVNLDASDKALDLASLCGCRAELLGLILDRPLTQVTMVETPEWAGRPKKKGKGGRPKKRGAA